MKKILMIVVPLVLLLGGGGGAFFAAKKGLINIPGVTPPKKKKPAPGVSIYADKKDDKVPEPKKEPEPEVEVKKEEKPAPPPTDPIQGAKKVAKLWNELPTDKLKLLCADWKTPDLARVIMAMNGEKSAELLASLDAPKASELSKEIQKQASVVVK